MHQVIFTADTAWKEHLKLITAVTIASSMVFVPLNGDVATVISAIFLLWQVITSAATKTCVLQCSPARSFSSYQYQNDSFQFNIVLEKMICIMNKLNCSAASLVLYFGLNGSSACSWPLLVQACLYGQMPPQLRGLSPCRCRNSSFSNRRFPPLAFPLLSSSVTVKKGKEKHNYRSDATIIYSVQLPTVASSCNCQTDIVYQITVNFPSYRNTCRPYVAQEHLNKDTLKYIYI